MFAIIIIAVLVLLAAGFSFYRRKPGHSSDPWETELQKPSSGGLFSDSRVSSPPSLALADSPEYREAKLLDRARGGDMGALSEALKSGNGILYQNVLDALIESSSNNREALLALVSYVTDSRELRGNRRLAERVIEEWNKDPDGVSTATMVHVAALSDDTATYARAVDLVVSSWKAGRLQFSADQLLELVESQYWLLATEARHGGTGFALKMRLFKLRRELLATTPAR